MSIHILYVVNVIGIHMTNACMDGLSRDDWMKGMMNDDWRVNHDHIHFNLSAEKRSGDQVSCQDNS